MPITWLGFWDIGQTINPTMANSPHDVSLLQLLAFGVFRSAPFKAWYATVLTTPTVWGELNLAERVSLIHQYLKYRNWTSAADSSTVPPGHQSPVANGMIVAMQRAIYLNDPVSPLSCLLRSPTGFSVGIASFGGEANLYSPWIGLQPAAGPRFALPFWDVSGDVGSTGENRPGDVTLVNWLLAQMLASPEFESVKPRSDPGRIALNDWITKVGPRCKELGWPIANPRVVSPTKGDIAAPSLIRPLNYYAFRNSGLYRHLANRDLSASTALWSAVQERVDSIHIKLTP